MAELYEQLPYDPLSGIAVGDHVEKLQTEKHQTKYVGKVLTIYRVPHESRLWAVVLLDRNEASDHLQHVYPIELFRKKKQNPERGADRPLSHERE